MKYLIVTLTIIWLSPFGTKAQGFPRVMPVGIENDTLINSSAILRKAGIKEIQTVNSNSRIVKTFDTQNCTINTNGKVNKTVTCFWKENSTQVAFCDSDTVIYNADGRIIFRKHTFKNAFIVYKGTPMNEYEWEYITLSQIESNAPDSIIEHEKYNEKGQIIYFKSENSDRVLFNNRYYYDADGFLDSISEGDNQGYVFKKIIKGNRKIIETRKPDGDRYSWEYNTLGQCIQFKYLVKHKPGLQFVNRHKKDIKRITQYYYNEDGTIAKIVHSGNDIKEYTISYTYIK